MKKASILDLPEDLLEEDPSMGIAKNYTTKPTTSIRLRKKSSEQIEIEGLLKEVAQILDIEFCELRDWAKETLAPMEVLKTILQTAKRFKLNPLLGHIKCESNDENHWVVYIPIDGWIALIHQEPTFQGIAFEQAPETENGIPVWMECTIYCSNLHQPLTVREYFTELKTDHPIWTQMPRRMLRHKTLQQCARLAFGISAPELTIPMTSPTSPTSYQPTASYPSGIQPNPKKLLKQKLWMYKLST